MTGKNKARLKTQQTACVFVNSNGRTYPILSPQSSCSKPTTCETPQISTQALNRASFTTDLVNGIHQRRCSLSLLHPLPTPHIVQHVDEYALEPHNLADSTIMDSESPRREHADPLVESSKMAEQRLKYERPLPVADSSINKTSLDTRSATSMKRADSKMSTTSEPSSPMPKDDSNSSTGIATLNVDGVSMHSDHSFDLGYKSRPAPPYVNMGHMRVWSSMYTRPLEDMLREILEVRYPVHDAEDEDERSPLLGFSLRGSDYEWVCGLSRSWCAKVRREEEDA